MPAPSAATSFPFTEARLKAIPDPPAGTRVRYRDAACPGLGLKAAGARRVFIWYAKANGRPVEIRLGRWPTMTVEAARKKAKTDVASDPVQVQRDRREQRLGLTLADAWKELLASPTRRDGRSALRPRTLASYKDSWKLVGPLLGTTVASEITGEEATALRAKVTTANGISQARRALALLSLLLGGLPKRANGRRVGRPTLEPRRRYMDAAELGALLRGLEAEPQLWRVFWMCCLLAPLRRGNIASSKWTDLSLTHPARWLVQAADAKGHRLLSMPIAEPLARILRDWRDQNPKETWVFPAGLTAGFRKGSSHIVSVQHAWKRALLLGEAVRICDAVADDGRARFGLFLKAVNAERERAWKSARGRATASRGGTPLSRCLDDLRAEAVGLGVDPAPLAIPDCVPHDLRRTAASWAVQAGASMAVVAASLGHKDTRVTEAHYGHLSDDPVRRMLGDNATRLLETTVLATTAGQR